MPFIRTISPKQAGPELAEVYRYMGEVGGAAEGPVANIVRMFSLRPDSMRRMIRTWELALWYGNEPRTTKETVASAVSRLNDCHY